MEGNEEKNINTKNDFSHGIIKEIQNRLPELNNITVLNLSNRNIIQFEDTFSLPPNLVQLDISHNKFTKVPLAVLELNSLRNLNVSNNSIVYFDDTPNFCQTIEHLNLSQNKLEGPPYWVWSESPKNLVILNISCNENLSTSFVNGYLEELLEFTTNVKEIDIYNCRLNKHVILMGTFSNARIINLGELKHDLRLNHIEQVPCEGLHECCDIERLNLSNTNIYNINSNIDMYEHLMEINLSNNMINSLPNEFCKLLHLQICVLSYNKLLYLPDDMYKLTELRILCLDNNQLCMLPACLCTLPNLKLLDLYNNNLCEELDAIDVKYLDEIDLAQNYFEEPRYEEYWIRKERLRLKLDMSTDSLRIDGSKPEQIDEESEHSSRTIDDEEFYAMVSNENVDPIQDTPKPDPSRSSSPEDWDSDEHWIPRYYPEANTSRSPWLYFIKQKMEEGNFCPMDAHPISITEKVRYEKLCNPQEQYESDGQFDDYSDDDS